MNVLDLFKNKGAVAAVVAVIFLLVILFSRKSGASTSAGPTQQTLYYGSGLTSQEAVELASQEINAQTADLATSSNLKANLANISALENVNLSNIAAGTEVQNNQIAATQAAAINTNQTNIALANLEVGAAEQLATDQANLEENITSQAAPSPFQRFGATLDSFFGATSPVSQLGSGATTSLANQAGSIIGAFAL